MALEEEFSIEIPDSEADKITSVDTAVNYISNQIIKLLGEKIEKTNKGINVKQTMIKNHLFLFLR